jgi:anaerobic carbon-monoxide dehydrogenase iron sulfur subunit
MGHTMGVLVITPENCTNCHSCELACSLFHEEEFNPDRARTEVRMWDNARSVSVMCLQCEEAGCMAICPAGAITEDKDTGARLVNELKCIKCKMCIQNCPFGCNFYDVRGRKILKCDLCSGDPQCAIVCPSGAIVHAERNTANVAKRQQAVEKLKLIARGARR